MVPDSSRNLVFRMMDRTDAEAIAAILQHFATKAVLLWRTVEDIVGHENDFYVLETAGELVGCVALHSYGNDLCELRSLAVREDYQGQGLGALIVKNVIDRARKSGVKTLFALTRKAVFFQKLGFTIEDMDNFPEKIWKDCQLCPKRDRCDETAVAIRFDH